jgi:hypothetical protein
VFKAFFMHVNVSFVCFFFGGKEMFCVFCAIYEVEAFEELVRNVGIYKEGKTGKIRL